MSYKDEPIYENIQKDVDYVKEIDERVINFLHIVKQAPDDIQKASNKFLSTLDKLKKNYILNIVRSKKVERRYNDATRFLVRRKRNYDHYRYQDDYLNQVSPDIIKRAAKKVEIAKVECSMSYCQLQLVVRELELSKEKLCRISKRAEHNFLSFLKSHPDKGWSQLYRNNSQQRTKGDLRRTRTSPLKKHIISKPEYSDSTESCNSCPHVRRSSSEFIPPGTHGKRSAKYLIKNEQNDSSEEEFPPPPSPPSLKFNLDALTPTTSHSTTDGQKKRLSDRSTVDEGIGDIDWNPSSLISDTDDTTGSSDILNLPDPLETELLADLDRITHLVDTLSRIPHERIGEISTDDILNGTAKILLDEQSGEENSDIQLLSRFSIGSQDLERNSTRNPVGISELMDTPMQSSMSSLDSDISLLTDCPDSTTESEMDEFDLNDFPDLPPELELNFPTDEVDAKTEILISKNSDSLKSNYASLNTSKNNKKESSDEDTNMSSNVKEINEKLEKKLSLAENKNETVNNVDVLIEYRDGISSMSINKIVDHFFVNDGLNAKETTDVINALDRANVDDTISQTSEVSHISYLNADKMEIRRPTTVRKEHVYEDVPRQPIKQKSKKSKINFLTKVFHGPWEGWEES